MTFNPGETEQTVTVNVRGDTTPEAKVAFTVSLTNPSEGTSIAVGVAAGTILNDDNPPAPPTFSIAATDANKAEGTGSSPTKKAERPASSTNYET